MRTSVAVVMLCGCPAEPEPVPAVCGAVVVATEVVWSRALIGVPHVERLTVAHGCDEGSLRAVAVVSGDPEFVAFEHRIALEPGESADLDLTFVATGYADRAGVLAVADAAVALVGRSEPDQDGDGIAATEAGGLDCNDRTQLIAPGRAEVCNGVDDDCDGDVDGGAIDARTWYADADGDGWGDPASAERSCQGGGGTTVGRDCDDTDPDAFPGAPDLTCDGVDQDCDGDDARVATWTDGAGVSDLTAVFGAGTAVAPTVWTAPGAGTLDVCDGRWYATVDVDVDGVALTGAATLDAARSGPVVALGPGRSIVIDGLELTGGYAAEGGGVSAVGSRVLLRDVAIRGNEATTRGGGVAAESVELIATTVADNRCTATGGGGAGGVDAAEVVVDGGAIEGNLSGVGAGGLASPSVAIDGARLGGNVGYYGAVASEDGVVTVTGATFLDNTSLYPGGGAIAATGSEVAIEGSTFEGNLGAYGGAIDADDSTVTIDSSTFVRNVALSNGGAVRVRGGSLEIVDSQLAENTAQAGGGAVWGGETLLTVTSTVFEDNEATRGSGGAVFVSDGVLLADGVEITGSHAATDGGAVSLLASDAYITAGIIQSNLAEDDGGGVALDGGSTLDVASCDLGVAESVTGNAPNAVWLAGPGAAYAVDGVATFQCDGAECR